jgi:hypothetical protein
VFNPPHPPKARAREAFGILLSVIRAEIIKSRRDWDIHEPEMWSRAKDLSDEQLTAFTVEDLVLVRAAPTSYGTIILGSFRIPAVNWEMVSSTSGTYSHFLQGRISLSMTPVASTIRLTRCAPRFRVRTCPRCSSKLAGCRRRNVPLHLDR